MAGLKMQFPDPGTVNNKWQDSNGQWWYFNNEAWVRKAEEPGIKDAPYTGQQFARVRPEPDFTDPQNPIYPPGYWELVQADVWYLGAHEVDPTYDTFGLPLVEGHTYYNTVTHVMMVWDGVEWDAFSGVSEIATLWEYRWDSLGQQDPGFILDALHSRNEESDPNWPGYPPPGDDHGNIPFDQWEKGLIIVTMYVNGRRVIEKRSLTPGYGEPPNDTPPRPSDEEHRLEFATLSAFPNPGQPLPVTYLDLSTDITHYWAEPDPDNAPGVFAYIVGGAELETPQYFYTVDYPNQEITFLLGLGDGDVVVIETGTLAASQYLKSTYENAEDWAFVTHDCDMGLTNPSRGLLPSQAAVNCYVKAALIEAESRSTNALIGSVFSFAGNKAPPNGLICNNSAVSKELFPILFERIGNIWNNWNGASTPATGQFRLPPSEISGFPLYYGGTLGANTVGTFLPSENKEHIHAANHGHTGSVTSAIGSHKHRVYYRSYGTVQISSSGKTVLDSLLTKAEYDARGGSKNINNHYRDTHPASAGTSGSNVIISESYTGTESEGGPINRPPTAIMLMCIWADVQSGNKSVVAPIFDINDPT